jgi:hypothetical protein
MDNILPPFKSFSLDASTTTATATTKRSTSLHRLASSRRLSSLSLFEPSVSTSADNNDYDNETTALNRILDTEYSDAELRRRRGSAGNISSSSKDGMIRAKKKPVMNRIMYPRGTNMGVNSSDNCPDRGTEAVAVAGPLSMEER